MFTTLYLAVSLAIHYFKACNILENVLLQAKYWSFTQTSKSTAPVWLQVSICNHWVYHNILQAFLRTFFFLWLFCLPGRNTMVPFPWWDLPFCILGLKAPETKQEKSGTIFWNITQCSFRGFCLLHLQEETKEKLCNTESSLKSR